MLMSKLKPFWMIASVYGLFCYRDMFWSWSTCWLPSLILYFFSLYSRHKALNFTYITSELDFFFLSFSLIMSCIWRICCVIFSLFVCWLLIYADCRMCIFVIVLLLLFPLSCFASMIDAFMKKPFFSVLVYAGFC